MAGLSIFSWFSYPLPIEERLLLIKDAGFDAVSLWWGDGDGKHTQPDMARRIGLAIDNIHAPFTNPNELWEDVQGGEDYLNMLISCIDDCSRHSITTIVLHVTRLSEKAPITKIGLNRIQRLVDYAEHKGINLALENMNSIDHLDMIFDTVKSDRLGFCFDSGHEHLVHPTIKALPRYGHRLFAVHLDDNYGDDDTHLLPYDGSIDWDNIKLELKNSRELPYLTLEVDFNVKHEQSGRYRELSAAEFLSLAFERLTRLTG